MTSIIKKYRYVLLGTLIPLIVLSVYWWSRPDPEKIRAERLHGQLQAQLQEIKELTPEQRRLFAEEWRRGFNRPSVSQSRRIVDEGKRQLNDKVTRFLAMSQTEQAAFLDREIDKAEALSQEQERESARLREAYPHLFPKGQTDRAKKKSSRNLEDRDRLRKQQLDLTTPYERALAAKYARMLAERRKARGLSAKIPKSLSLDVADPKYIAGLLAGLESETPDVQRQALDELLMLGDLAEPALRQALAGQPSIELRKKIQELLARSGPVDYSRSQKTYEMLENLGTPEARLVLETLAQGSPRSRLTQQAKQALERMGP